MKLIKYREASAFHDRTHKHLEQNESANNLMLGITQQLMKKSFTPEYTPFFATVEDTGGIVLAALQTPPKRLVIYGRENKPRRPAGMLRAFEMLVASLLAEKHKVPGVIGEVQSAALFKNEWMKKKGCENSVFMNQRIYVLREILYKSDVQGHFRPASPKDLNLIGNWLVGFAEFIHDPINLNEGIKRAHNRIARKELYVWENRTAVSMATIARRTKSGGVISGVYTPPKHRVKGYAMACVSALSQLMLNSGFTFCSLFADLANPVSNHIYQKIGYRPVCDYVMYDFIE
jgi:predicted GNAT family acetyltransferase